MNFNERIIEGFLNEKNIIRTAGVAAGAEPCGVFATIVRADNSSVTDVSPLASLTGLKQLYLAGCQVKQWKWEKPSPLLLPDMEWIPLRLNGRQRKNPW
jgi:hypothetical protein